MTHHEKVEATETGTTAAGGPVIARAGDPLVTQVLSLQRSAGNRATRRMLARRRMLQRQPRPSTAAPAATPAGAMDAMTPEDMFNKLVGHVYFENEKYGHVPVHELDQMPARIQAAEEEMRARQRALDANPTSREAQSDLRAARRNVDTLRKRYELSRRPPAMPRRLSAGPAMAASGGGSESPRPGYNTSAIIQVVDKDEKIVAVAFGDYDSAGHAEEHALTSLRRQLGGRKVPAGRIEVVGDQTVCTHTCTPALSQFAQDIEADRVDGHVFQRPVLTQALGSETRYAGGKATMKTLTKATTTDRVPRRATTVVYERPGARPRPGGGGGGGGGSAPPRGGRGAFDPGGPGVGPGTASAVRIGVPIAQALWAPWFKEQLLKDIEALPKPEADTRQAGAYLRDPRTREAAKTLDILGKNLPAFTAQLDGDAARTIGTAKLELAATALVEGSDQAAYERRIERIDAIKEQLSAYLEDLLTIRDNLDALLELEGRATEAKRSSDELYGLLDDKYVAAYVVEKDILSVEQLSAVKSSLSHLSVTISMTFGDAHAAHDAALRHIAAIQDMLDDVGAIWWSQMGEQFEAHLKARHAAAMASADRQEKAAGVPSPQRPSTRLLNSDELGTRALYNTREAEIRRELGMLGDPVSGESPETAQRRRELLDELIEIREARRKAGL